MSTRTQIIILIAFLFGLTGCNGNEPWIPVNSSEKVVNHGFIKWNFQEGTDGFFNSKGKACQSKNGFLLWRQSSGGYLTSPEKLCIPAEKAHTVELRLASTCATLNLLWKQEGGAFTQSVSIPLISDGQYHDYQIELGQNIHWTGTVSQLAFQTKTNSNIAIDFIRLTGLYFVPFPFSNELLALKRLFSEADQSIIIGFSSLVEFLSDVDNNGDYRYYHYNEGEENATGRNPHHLLKQAKASDMPVMIWLRGDPWGYAERGAYKQLFADDNNLMWTAQTTANPTYRNKNSGYAYLCLAQEELDGTTPAYWRQTDKLLGQCAEEIGRLIQDNPDHILGVTTTSEYKFNTEDQKDDLDYNPKTIREFRNYCKQKYGSLSALNSSCGTDFTTFELKSSDFNPMTIEAEGGFDAPRTRGVPVAFWNEWKTFRAQQIQKAVRRQVECIAQHIDRKYIYSHQIASEIAVCESPTHCGNVPGANVGIDMFTHEVTEATIKEISSFVKAEAHRSWGVPEWLVLRESDPVRTVDAMKLMRAYGIKYLTPFHWNGGGEFDIKDTPAFEAIRHYLKDY